MSTRKRPLPPLETRPTTTISERPLAGAIDVPLAQVLPDPTQPRRDWEHADGQNRLDELAASIREFGVLQPLLVREDEAYTEEQPLYRIIAGARRRAAAERAGLATLPVVVRSHDTARARILQLIENLQRADLSPLDEARAYQELMDLEGLSAEAAGDRLFISGQKVRERLRLLADQVLAAAVERRQISATAARDIGRLPDEQLHAFRKRILEGEVLQSNDVATARAELAARGLINPRIKRPPLRRVDQAPLELMGVAPVRPDGSLAWPTRIAVVARTAGALPEEGNRAPATDQQPTPALPPGETPADAGRRATMRRLVVAAVRQVFAERPDLLPALRAVLASPETAEWSQAVLADVVAGRQDD